MELLILADMIWDPFIWIGVVIAAGLFALAWVVVANPNLVARGQDAAGKGMAVGCVAILLISACGLLGIGLILLTLILGHEFNPVTRIVAFVPVALVLGLVVFTLVVENIRRVRSEQKEWREKMAIPMFALCDIDDATMSALYTALNEAYPGMLMHLRQPGALHWQQDETYPRAKLITLNAEIVDESGAQMPNDTKIVVDDLCVWNPTGALIVLYAADLPKVEPHAARLRARGWLVEIVRRDRTEEWIGASLIPLVKSRVKISSPNLESAG